MWEEGSGVEVECLREGVRGLVKVCDGQNQR